MSKIFHQNPHATRAAGISDALLHRLDPRSALTENGRRYRHMSILEMGRDCLGLSDICPSENMAANTTAA